MGVGEFFATIAPYLPALGALAWAVYLHWYGARKADFAKIDARIDGVEKAFNAHKDAGQASRAELSERLVHVERTLAQMPDKDSVHALNVAVTEIRGDMKAHGEALRAIGATANRVEEYLLKQGGQ